MHYCPNCGNDHVEGSSICFKCGAKLDGNSSSIELNNNSNTNNITDKSDNVNNNDNKVMNDLFLSNLFGLKRLRNIPILKLLENKDKFSQNNYVYTEAYNKTAKYTIMLYVIFFLIVFILRIKVLDFFIWILPLFYFLSTGLFNSITGIFIGLKSYIITKQSESLNCIFINLLVIVATILYASSFEYIVESFY
mgnify:FL=1